MRFILLVLSLALAPTVLMAQDQCKDVLINAVLDKMKIDYSHETKLVTVATASQNSEEAETLGMGAAFPVEGLPVEATLDWTRNQAKQLATRYDLSLAYTNRGSLLMLSGQAAVIQAWRDCMAKRSGGFGIYFTKIGDGETQVFLHLEYLRDPLDRAVQPPMTLTDDVFIDKALAVANSRCLKKGYVIEAGESCSVQLVVPSAWTTLPVVMSFELASEKNLTFNEILLPRVRPQVNYHTIAGALPPLYTYNHPVPNPQVCQPAPDGYSFIAVRISTQARGAALVNNTCQSSFAYNETRTQVCFTSGITGNFPAKADYYCDWQWTADTAHISLMPPREE